MSPVHSSREIWPMVRQHVRQVQPPLVVADGVYDRGTILENLRISERTFHQWIVEGLPATRHHSKRLFVIGRDLIEFLQQRRLRRPDSGGSGSH